MVADMILRHLPAAFSAAAFLSLIAPYAAHAADSPPRSERDCQTVVPTLRLDFNNVGFFKCDADTLVESQGAQISATFDQLAHHTSISGDGIAALIVRPKIGNGDGVIGLVFGPYIQADGTYQFKSQASPQKQTSTLVEGGFIQVNFNPPGTASNEYFRFRAGAQQSSTGASSTTMVGEWLPYLPMGWGFIPPLGRTFNEGSLDLVLTPEVVLQYDHLDAGPRSAVLFSTGASALRIGPQIGLLLSPKTCTNTDTEPHRCDGADNPSHNSLLGLLSLNLIAHISDDTSSGRRYAWGMATLTYNWTPNFGLSASYGAGNSEATANQTSQIKLGLSIKY
jgi:hypothetical protein